MVVGGGGDPLGDSLGLLEAGLDLTRLDEPNVLHIGTAAPTLSAFARSLSAIVDYGRDHGMSVMPFHAFGELPTPDEAADLLDWADAILVDDGDEKLLMQRWTTGGLLTVIGKPVADGTVVVIGSGAGAVPWFTRGHSDADRHKGEGAWGYDEVDGLGILQAVICPGLDTTHPNTLEPRLDAFKGMLGSWPNGTVGIGLARNAGLQIEGDEASVLGGSGLARLTVANGKVIVDRFPEGSTRLPLNTFVQ